MAEPLVSREARSASRLSLVFAGVSFNAAEHMQRHTCFRWAAGLVVALVFTSLQLSAQANSPTFELASLREDVRMLSQRVNELSLRVEQLERDNNELRSKAGGTYVTIAQLDEAIADIQKTLQAAMQDQRRETLQQVSGQLGKLADETQAAISAVLNGERYVDMPPASPIVRRIQHEMARDAELVSHSYGKEPRRHVRIFRE